MENACRTAITAATQHARIRVAITLAARDTFLLVGIAVTRCPYNVIIRACFIFSPLLTGIDSPYTKALRGASGCRWVLGLVPSYAASKSSKGYTTQNSILFLHYRKALIARRS